MRLTCREIDSIKTIIKSVDPNAYIYLFGSRVDDAKRGGDIDIIIVSESITEAKRLDIRHRLYEQLGEQKIDIIITRDKQEPFVKVAFENAVEI